jgi:hypothetical protein
MATEFNGNGPKYCKNCGGMEGIHQSETDRCPNRGEDQTGLNPPIWSNTTFEPQEWEKESLPDDMKRLPLNQEIRTEDRTLFDDYYIAAIQGAAMGFGDLHPTSDDDVRTAARVFALFAFEVSKEAIKNRALYLYGEYKE